MQQGILCQGKYFKISLLIDFASSTFSSHFQFSFPGELEDIGAERLHLEALERSHQAKGQSMHKQSYIYTLLCKKQQFVFIARIYM